MKNYWLKRILGSVVTLLLASFLVFVLTDLLPGDPTDYFSGVESGRNENQLQVLRQELGLDQPFLKRYLEWLSLTLKGDLGTRFKNGERVLQSVTYALKNSAILGIPAIFFAFVTALFSSIFFKLRGGLLLAAFESIALFFNTLPSFVLGLILLSLFSVTFHLFPSGAMFSLEQTNHSIWQLIWHAALPIITLFAAYFGVFSKTTLDSVSQVLRSDYIRYAKAKGVPKFRVVFRHALRNAILPIITTLGLVIPQLAAGALFTETIFSWPGVGLLYLDAIQSRDYPLIMGLNLVISFLVVVVTLIVDLLYGFIDPRVRYANS